MDEGFQGPFRTRQVILGVALFQLLITCLTLGNVTRFVGWSNILMVISIAWCLAAIVGIFVLQEEDRGLHWIELLSLAYFSVVLLLYAHAYVTIHPEYTTDEIAFDQQAATLLLHGKNPYNISMLPALHTFHVPQVYWTLKMNGGIIQHLSYPALSFLLYVPFVPILPHGALYVDVAFWVISVWVLYVSLRSPWKPLALFFGACSLYVGSDLTGLTDSLFMPFLLIVARTSSWFYLQTGKRQWIAPIAFGCAAAIKQTAWFLIPLVLLAVYKETRSVKRVMHYAGVSAVTFLVPNLYFIIVGPVSWMQDVLAPFLSGLLPSGQGLIRLPIMGITGGGHLSLFTVSAILLLLGMVTNLWFNYDRLRNVLFVLPSIVLFFPLRSFEQYFVDLIPIVFVSVLATRPQQSLEGIVQQEKGKVNYWLRGYVVYFPFLLCLLFALVTPPPIQVSNILLHYSQQDHGITRIDLTIRNGTGAQVEPHVTVFNGSTYTNFWKITSGQAQLGSKKELQYTLVPSSAKSIDLLSGGFHVDVVSAHPAAIAVSPLYVPTMWKTYAIHKGDSLIVHVLNGGIAPNTSRGGGAANGSTEGMRAESVTVQGLPVYIQVMNASTGRILQTIMRKTDATGTVRLELKSARIKNGAGDGSGRSVQLNFQAYLSTGNGPYGFSGVVE